MVHLESVSSRTPRSWQGSHTSRLALRARRKGRARKPAVSLGAVGAIGFASARRRNQAGISDMWLAPGPWPLAVGADSLTAHRCAWRVVSIRCSRLAHAALPVSSPLLTAEVACSLENYC